MPTGHPFFRSVALAAVRLLEAIVFGGRLREKLLAGLLGALHRSQFRREWRFFSDEAPHFFNQRWNGFELVYGDARTPYPFTRGFLACEVLREGDRLLDIGCGDGFLTNAFCAERCRHIDAIDIEPTAIETARRLNANAKIDFRVLDAVRDPFPAERYDVVVWDGAIGHFSAADLATMLQKIRGALAPSGLFIGSESLGSEGADHLQFFDDEAALAAVFRPYFRHVLVRTMQYRIRGGALRREAYWRCADEMSDRQAGTAWNDFAGRGGGATPP